MPGQCKGCGGRVHRKTKGGKWYQLCDDCRLTEPPDDGQDDAIVEQQLERRKAELARAVPTTQIPTPDLPEARPPAELPARKPYTVERDAGEIRVDYRSDTPSGRRDWLGRPLAPGMPHQPPPEEDDIEHAPF